MANKQDVLDAFYEGVVAVLAADYQCALVDSIEIDREEFGRWLDRHPAYEEYRIYANPDAM